MRFLKCAAVTALSLVLLTTTCFAAASVPYDTYTIDTDDYSEAYSPAAFVPDITLKGSAINMKSNSAYADLEVFQNQLYLLDKGANQIVILDQDFQKKAVIQSFDNQGKTDFFHSPEGLTVAPDGTIYVADTENSRIVRLDAEGKLLNLFTQPKVDVLGDYSYKPIKVGVNRAGRMYVIARGVNRGLMELGKDGSFFNFVGAPKVSYDMFTVLWKTLLPKSASKYLKQFIPTEFSNLEINSKGFIYTTIRANNFQDTFQAIQSKNQESVKSVMCINSAGKDILRRYGMIPILGDVNWTLSTDTEDSPSNDKNPSAFEDIAVDEAGCYYVADSRRSRIFAYDNDGNLLYAFGAAGTENGNNMNPTAIVCFGDQLVVLDSGSNKLSVYMPTSYGQAIKSAALAYSKGYYQESLEKWQSVYKFNGNLTLAYVGMGKSYYRLQDYDNAVKYLTLANEKTYCSKAYAELRKEVIAEWFLIIFAVVISVIVLLFFLLLRNKKKKKVRKKSRFSELSIVKGLRYSLHIIIHPFDGFWDLKHEKRGNPASATVILVLAVLSYCFYRRYAGYFFISYDPQQRNLLIDLITVLLPVCLFVLVNWCLTTLMEGSGNMKDIYIATCYSFTPIAIGLIPLTLISRVLCLDEQAYYQVVLVFLMIWTGALLFFGTMITHEYSLLKTVITVMMILIGIVVVIFLLLLFYNLIQEMLSFLFNSYDELSFRLY
ncbi:MAG: YIP1 family protein [Clostridiales bacterium]|nr:YIP1 family protein [Clostridiales bacterium]